MAYQIDKIGVGLAEQIAAERRERLREDARALAREEAGLGRRDGCQVPANRAFGLGLGEVVDQAVSGREHHSNIWGGPTSTSSRRRLGGPASSD